MNVGGGSRRGKAWLVDVEEGSRRSLFCCLTSQCDSVSGRVLSCSELFRDVYNCRGDLGCRVSVSVSCSDNSYHNRTVVSGVTRGEIVNLEYGRS